MRKSVPGLIEDCLRSLWDENYQNTDLGSARIHQLLNDKIVVGRGVSSYLKTFYQQHLIVRFLLLIISVIVCHSTIMAQADSTNSNKPPLMESLFISSEDGWVDMTGFIDSDFGFLPVAMPISEPAVGYGLAGGISFINKSKNARRPNITFFGGFGTQNGTWGVVAGDSRYWLGDRLQTLAGVIYSTINLDYYGIGENNELSENPLKYTLEPKGGLLQTKYKIDNSNFFIGIGYAYFTINASFDSTSEIKYLPDYSSKANVAGVALSMNYDDRDNMFTPRTGTYAEVSAGFCGKIFGGDDEFQRVQLMAMQYFGLEPRLFLGMKGLISANFGDAPFYLNPFIYMRGVPAMRYLGEQVAQAETEMRWQFWKRFSLVGFMGVGYAWTDLEKFQNTQSTLAGGVGFRYELTRKYGIHMGLDLAYGPDEPVIYITVGSAWVRP